MAKHGETIVGVRMTEQEKEALVRDAKRSGWSLSKQVRYELLKPRGLWKEIKPYVPSQGAPSKA